MHTYLCVTNSENSKLCTFYNFVENESGITNIDYYTSLAFPNFDTIPAYERHYTLNVTIVPDQILENNELFDVTAKPEHVPAGQPECSTAVIIRDDDGNFKYKHCKVCLHIAVL